MEQNTGVNYSMGQVWLTELPCSPEPRMEKLQVLQSRLEPENLLLKWIFCFPNTACREVNVNSSLNVYGSPLTWNGLSRRDVLQTHKPSALPLG